MDAENNQSKKIGKTKIVLAVLALGAVCGLFEVVLGGFLKNTGFPYRSGLLVGLGFGVIGFAYAIFKKPLMAIGIGLVAAFCKQLGVIVLHLPVMCMMNSCVAVLLEYGALAIIALVLMNRMKEKVSLRLIAGGAAALIGAGAFHYIGMRVAPCNYLLTFNRAGGFVDFMIQQGLVWVAFSVVLFPLGWLVGEKVSGKIGHIMFSKPRLFYAETAITTIFCVAICAIAIAGGY
jgi:hypothetical protein